MWTGYSTRKITSHGSWEKQIRVMWTMYFSSTTHITRPAGRSSSFLVWTCCWLPNRNLTEYMLNYFQLLNFSTSVTVGECLGDPPENWYRAAGGAANHSLLVCSFHRPFLHSDQLTTHSYIKVKAARLLQAAFCNTPHYLLSVGSL